MHRTLDNLINCLIYDTRYWTKILLERGKGKVMVHVESVRCGHIKKTASYLNYHENILRFMLGYTKQN